MNICKRPQNLIFETQKFSVFSVNFVFHYHCAVSTIFLAHLGWLFSKVCLIIKNTPGKVQSKLTLQLTLLHCVSLLVNTTWKVFIRLHFCTTSAFWMLLFCCITKLDMDQNSIDQQLKQNPIQDYLCILLSIFRMSQ